MTGSSITGDDVPPCIQTETYMLAKLFGLTTTSTGAFWCCWRHLATPHHPPRIIKQASLDRIKIIWWDFDEAFGYSLLNSKAVQNKIEKLFWEKMSLLLAPWCVAPWLLWKAFVSYWGSCTGCKHNPSEWGTQCVFGPTFCKGMLPQVGHQFWWRIEQDGDPLRWQLQFGVQPYWDTIKTRLWKHSLQPFEFNGATTRRSFEACTSTVSSIVHTCCVEVSPLIVRWRTWW